MKQFNIEDYVQNPNRKVVTRDGHSVRIICTDRISDYPVVALISNEDTEDLLSYTKDGEVYTTLFEKNDFDKKILHWSEGGIIYEKDGSNGYNIAIRRFDAPFGPSANVHYVHELQQLLRLGGYTELANSVEL